MKRTGLARLMARYNGWMNDKVLEAASGLTDRELREDRQAFFGSILATLNHLVVADKIWLQRFARHPGCAPVLERLGVRAVMDPVAMLRFDGLEALKAHRSSLDAIIVEWASSLTEPDMDVVLQYEDLKGKTHEGDFAGLLMHFFNHQAHHRGQATTLLSQAGIDVGATDLSALVATAQ